MTGTSGQVRPARRVRRPRSGRRHGNGLIDDLRGCGFVAARRGGGFERRTGASMAAPQVTGAIARLLTREPDASVAEVLATLRRTRPARAQASTSAATVRVSSRRELRRF